MDCTEATRRIPTVRRRVDLEHCPVAFEARSVHFADEAGMQVALGIGARYHLAETFMTSAEARKLAAALVEAADHFDAEAAKLPADEPVEA